MTLKHKFVEYIPDQIEESIIYLALQHSTAVHNCMCGCGNEVVTPFSVSDWSIKFDGESITLDPSIGNWNFECRSHYWIKKSKVIWADNWNQNRINDNRKKDENIKTELFNQTYTSSNSKKTITNNNWYHRFKRILKLW
jgi:hypothetical protein